MCVCVCVCVPMPTHCTITRFGFQQGENIALSVVYFRITHRLGRPHYVWGEYLYSLLEKVEVRVTVSVTVCVVLLCCVEWWWKEGIMLNPVPTHSLLSSKSNKGAARLDVPIRRTNRYQQYYISSAHTNCGKNYNILLQVYFLVDQSFATV